MHPDNNPLDLAAGQLYVKDPETGETLPMSINLGSCETLAEFTTYDNAPAVERCAGAVARQFNLPAEISITLEPADLESFETWRQNLVATYQEWLQKVVIEQEQACIAWAKVHRKKWLHIGRTTKKARLRKKYAKLIWRDYKAARAAALARIAGEA